MTERDDDILQDTAADLPQTSFYKSKEWLRQRALENRSDDAVFSAKSVDEVSQLDSLRDAISHFFDAHLPTFERISQNIKNFENGLHAFDGGKEEACKLFDPALFTLLIALREKLLHILEDPRQYQYKRDVEIQRDSPGWSLSSQLKILSQRAWAALEQTFAKIEESLRNFAMDVSAQQSRPDFFYRELESIYQGHRADHKLVVDTIKRQCPNYIAESLDVLNRFMASEAREAILGNSARLLELLIEPLSTLSTDLQALDFAMDRLDNLNTTAKCIRAGGEGARLATLNLITEQLRISLESMKPRIESH